MERGNFLAVSTKARPFVQLDGLGKERSRGERDPPIAAFFCEALYPIEQLSTDALTADHRRNGHAAHVQLLASRNRRHRPHHGVTSYRDLYRTLFQPAEDLSRRGRRGGKRLRRVQRLEFLERLLEERRNCRCIGCVRGPYAIRHGDFL